MNRPDPGDKAQENWLDRIKSALGLNEPATLREGLEDALQEPADGSADITPAERGLLVNVLGMRDVRVSDVMTARARIVGISRNATLAELLVAFRSSDHARMLVYGETLDDPQGMIHIRDFLGHLAGADAAAPFAESHVLLTRTIGETALIRPVLFVPPSTPALDLMVRMQTKRLHMAMVIDEYGETDGLVTMEDLVEVIVGDIDDEHDMPEPAQIIRREDGTVDASAEARLSEVAAMAGLDLAGDRIASEVDSIGGYVTALAGHVPQTGATIAGPGGASFLILDAEARKVHRLLVRPALSVAPDHPGGLDLP